MKFSIGEIFLGSWNFSGKNWVCRKKGLDTELLFNFKITYFKISFQNIYLFKGWLSIRIMYYSAFTQHPNESTWEEPEPIQVLPYSTSEKKMHEKKVKNTLHAFLLLLFLLKSIKVKEKRFHIFISPSANMP